MTRKEYFALKKRGQTLTARELIKALKSVRLLYVARTRKVLALLRTIPGGTLSPENRARLTKALGRDECYEKINAALNASRAKVIENSFLADKEYIASAASEAGIELNLSGIFARAATRVDAKYKAKSSALRAGEIVFNRADYSLSSSIWDAVDDFSSKILQIIAAELAAGTDPVKVARLVEQYLAGGPSVVLGRWEQLGIGTREYRARLGTKGADYRTQRLVRTELYRARRDADIQSGAMNPGTTGMYDWNLSSTSTHCSICEDNAANGPYTEARIRELQDESHPNDACYISPVMKDHDTFIAQLRDYSHGADTPGAAEIGSWAAKYGVEG